MRAAVFQSQSASSSNFHLNNTLWSCRSMRSTPFAHFSGLFVDISYWPAARPVSTQDKTNSEENECLQPRAKGDFKARFRVCTVYDSAWCNAPHLTSGRIAPSCCADSGCVSIVVSCPNRYQWNVSHSLHKISWLFENVSFWRSPLLYL